jgi:hypothetical protein
MTADTIIKAVQAELYNHTFDAYLSETPSIAQGARTAANRCRA